MVFQVYGEGLSSYDAARLIHVCDGATLPNQEVQEWYGRAAILLEGHFIGQVPDLLLQVVAPDDDGPPPRLTAEEEAFYAEIEEELREAAETKTRSTPGRT